MGITDRANREDAFHPTRRLTLAGLNAVFDAACRRSSDEMRRHRILVLSARSIACFGRLRRRQCAIAVAEEAQKRDRLSNPPGIGGMPL
jgi:hypothetical protein